MPTPRAMFRILSGSGGGGGGEGGGEGGGLWAIFMLIKH